MEWTVRPMDKKFTKKELLYKILHNRHIQFSCHHVVFTLSVHSCFRIKHTTLFFPVRVTFVLMRMLIIIVWQNLSQTLHQISTKDMFFDPWVHQDCKSPFGNKILTPKFGLHIYNTPSSSSHSETFIRSISVHCSYKASSSIKKYFREVLAAR